jgi:hypothetical protein
MNVMERRMLDVLNEHSALADVLLRNKRRQGQNPSKIVSYTYSTRFVNVAAAALGANTGTQQQIATAGNSDFLMIYMSSSVYNNATQAAITNPYAAWQFNDNFNQTTMFSEPTFVSTTTGGGGFPYLLQDPKLIPASTNMIITFYNYSTVGPIALTAEFVFGGFRVFY